MNTIFYLTGAIAIVSSLMAISRKNAIHGLLYFIISLLSVSIIYYIMGAPLVAALEVMVYAGAIMVLFIFVVMMLNIGIEEEVEKRWLTPGTWIFPSVLAVALLVIFFFIVKDIKGNITVADIGPKKVGIRLFTEYMVVVELSAMLLMAGIVGTYHLGKSRKRIVHRYFEKQGNKKQ